MGSDLNGECRKQIKSNGRFVEKECVKKKGKSIAMHTNELMCALSSYRTPHTTTIDYGCPAAAAAALALAFRMTGALGLTCVTVSIEPGGLPFHELYDSANASNALAKSTAAADGGVAGRPLRRAGAAAAAGAVALALALASVLATATAVGEAGDALASAAAAEGPPGAGGTSATGAGAAPIGGVPGAAVLLSPTKNEAVAGKLDAVPSSRVSPNRYGGDPPYGRRVMAAGSLASSETDRATICDSSHPAARARSARDRHCTCA
jgi:hypothetical protein